MITNEMKGKIFAAYLGSKARRFYRNTGEDTGSHIESDLENINALCFGTGSYTYKLILTPLSEITDEDAIEVAKILNTGHTVHTHYDVAREANRVDVWLGYTCIHIYHDGSILCESLIRGWANHDIADFLRSKGYALSYMGIDLFESGIAIPNNKNQ